MSSVSVGVGVIGIRLDHFGVFSIVEFPSEIDWEEFAPVPSHLAFGAEAVITLAR